MNVDWRSFHQCNVDTQRRPNIFLYFIFYKSESRWSWMSIKRGFRTRPSIVACCVRGMSVGVHVRERAASFLVKEQMTTCPFIYSPALIVSHCERKPFGHWPSDGIDRARTTSRESLRKQSGQERRRHWWTHRTPHTLSTRTLRVPTRVSEWGGAATWPSSALLASPAHFIVLLRFVCALNQNTRTADRMYFLMYRVCTFLEYLPYIEDTTVTVHCVNVAH